MKTTHIILTLAGVAALWCNAAAIMPSRIDSRVLVPDTLLTTACKTATIDGWRAATVAASASDGDPAALSRLASWYSTGALPRDSVRASLLYRRAAAIDTATAVKGAPLFTAMTEAAIIADRRPISHADSLRLKQLYTMAAVKGSAEAMTRLGELISDTAATEAAGLLQSAADAGNAEAARRYSHMLAARPDATDSDKAMAASYLTTAADLGDPQAMYEEGLRLVSDRNNSERAKGAAMLLQAAAADCGDAQWHLALTAASPRNKDRDYITATHWLGRSMYNGYGMRVRDALSSRPGDLPQRFVTYLRALRKASDGKAGEALTLLAGIERKGMRDVTVTRSVIALARRGATHADSVRAIRTLKECADAGYSPASDALGSMYADEDSHDYNVNDALRFTRKAADAGYGPAMLRLADMCYEGRCVEADTAGAIDLYRSATASGYISAKSLRRLSRAMGAHAEGDKVLEAAALSACPAADSRRTLMRIIP